jgi:galactonate dehydratase
MSKAGRISAIDSFAYWPDRALKPHLIVRVATTDGLVGWGESGFTFREHAVEGAIVHLRDLVLGRDPFDTGAIWQECYRRAYFEGCRATSAALSAIDVALHDIKGQALGVPVHALLGGAQRDQIACFATTSGATAVDMIANAQNLQAQGFAALRLHILPLPDAHGRFDPRAAVAETADATRAVRAALGRKIMIGLDFHHRLSPAEAMSFCARLSSGDLDFLEEPIRAETPEAYEQLRRATDIPFAIGEEFTSKWQFRPYVERGILNFARIDLGNVGGFTEAMKIAGWCEARYIDVMPHNPLGPINTAATLHFAAAIANLDYLEARAHQIADPLSVDAHLFPDQPVMRGTAFDVPTKPGLGVTVDEAALAEETARYRRGDHPRLTRPDGSYTNS